MADGNIRNRIKPRDRVKLRCGAVLEAAEEAYNLFLGGVYLPQWATNGRFSAARETALDIVEILPRPMTDAERLAKIADLVASRGERADVLSAIMALAAPPAPLDPGREVTNTDWSLQVKSGGTPWDMATRIVRDRLAEAEAARHE
jgi:hypothetical protein